MRLLYQGVETWGDYSEGAWHLENLSREWGEPSAWAPLDRPFDVPNLPHSFCVWWDPNHIDAHQGES